MFYESIVCKVVETECGRDGESASTVTEDEQVEDVVPDATRVPGTAADPSERPGNRRSPAKRSLRAPHTSPSSHTAQSHIARLLLPPGVGGRSLSSFCLTTSLLSNDI